MRSASRPCNACGRPTDRHQELCAHCQRGMSPLSAARGLCEPHSMAATTAFVIDDDGDAWDVDSRNAMIAD
jgi:hypothetical protein